MPSLIDNTGDEDESRDPPIIRPSNDDEQRVPLVGGDFENHDRRQAGDGLLSLARQPPRQVVNETALGGHPDDPPVHRADAAAHAVIVGVQGDNESVDGAANRVPPFGPVTLSPPRSFYSEENNDFFSDEAIMDIIEHIDLNSKFSILKEIPLPPNVALRNSHFPKPPNHVIVGVDCEHSWNEAILSMAAFRLMSLPE